MKTRTSGAAVKHVKEFLDKLTPEQAVEIVSPWAQRRNNRKAGATAFDAAALLTAFGSTKRADYVDEGQAWKEYDALRDAEPIQQNAAVLMSVVQVWIRRLNIQISHNVAAQAADARRMCQILGLDFAAIEAEACKAIPEPKSWANLRDDNPSADDPGNDSSVRVDPRTGAECREPFESDSGNQESAEPSDDSEGTGAEFDENWDQRAGPIPESAPPPDWPATFGNGRRRSESEAVANAV